MNNDCYFQDEWNKTKNHFILFPKFKDKHESYIDTIPEQYKRKEYIIDKLNPKNKNVDR